MVLIIAFKGLAPAQAAPQLFITVNTVGSLAHISFRSAACETFI